MRDEPLQSGSGVGSSGEELNQAMLGGGETINQAILNNGT